jgi:biopolymer transport protein ExbD
MPELRLEMAPLIDVVFLLLTFFVFAMLLMVRAEVLDVTLPGLAAGRPAERAEGITITLDASGVVYLEAQQVEPDALIGAVRAVRAERPDAPINIAADTACPAGALLGVIDRLSEAGLGSFQLFGTPEREP